jgi:tRNA A-37 threonylcarbamoyl transferase component Bud32
MRNWGVIDFAFGVMEFGKEGNGTDLPIYKASLTSSSSKFSASLYIGLYNT